MVTSSEVPAPAVISVVFPMVMVLVELVLEVAEVAQEDQCAVILGGVTARGATSANFRMVATTKRGAVEGRGQETGRVRIAVRWFSLPGASASNATQRKMAPRALEYLQEVPILMHLLRRSLQRTSGNSLVQRKG